MILIEEMRIYILNTTRFYHEDFEEYPGAWFSCPVDFEEIRERLGVQSEEEIEIAPGFRHCQKSGSWP